MPIPITSRLDIPDSAQEFEKMVNAAAQIKWQRTHFQRYGRPGQQQNGVDTYGHAGAYAGIAIQCKNSCHSLPFRVVQTEVEKAMEFPHRITSLFIATTQANDKSLQDATWTLSASRSKRDLFSVSLLFWEDIVAELTKDRPTLVSFYPHLAGTSNDDAVLDEIKRMLPYRGSIDFVKNYRFCSATFDDRNLNDLYEFWDRCDDPSFAFQDQRLESLRLDLVDRIRDLTGLIGAHYTRVPGREVLGFHNYADKVYVEQVRTQMETAADSLVATYQQLLSPRN